MHDTVQDRAAQIQDTFNSAGFQEVREIFQANDLLLIYGYCVAHFKVLPSLERIVCVRYAIIVRDYRSLATYYYVSFVTMKSYVFTYQKIIKKQ